MINSITITIKALINWVTSVALIVKCVIVSLRIRSRITIRELLSWNERIRVIVNYWSTTNNRVSRVHTISVARFNDLGLLLEVIQGSLLLLL